MELLRRYSKLPLLSVVSKPSTVLRPQPEPAPPHKLSRRLAPEVLEQLVADYQAGASCRQVAVRYGVSKASVMRLLGERGELRPQRVLDDALLDEAAVLYATGLSLQTVGERLGVSASALCRLFRLRGIPTRLPYIRRETED